MADYWMKLYIEILDDPKMAVLPDRLWRRIVELFLLAKRANKDGHLPDTRQIAWALRMNPDDLEMDLQQIASTKIVIKTFDGWFIPKFAARQAAASSTERVHQFRKRQQKQQYNGVETHLKRKVTQSRLTDTEAEEEESIPAAPPFIPPIEKPVGTGVSIEKLVMEATGMPSIPPSEYGRIEQIRSLIDYYGEEGVRESFRANYQRWTNTKRKDNSGTYRGTNFGWVDWAQDELAGGGSHEKSWDDMNQAEREQFILNGGIPQ